MIIRNSNQCHLRKVLIKLAIYNFQRFPLISLTYSCQVNYVSFRSFLDSMRPFITKSYSFHLQFSCTFFFHTTTTKSIISKPTFWCTTLITLYIQIHAKGRLNKLLSLLLIFWVAFAPCLCTTPCRLKGNLKDCYAGHIFFFIFIYPLQFFISMLRYKKHKGFYK